MNDRFRLVPKISLAISHFKNETGLGIVDGGTGSIGEILSQDFELWAATYAGSLQLRYDEEFGRGRAELRATVTGAYTDVVDAPADSLKVSGWTTMTTARARWSEPADFTLFGQPVGWNITSTLTVPSGAGREALGFRFLLGAGGGLDLDLRDRNLPFVQALRPSLSLLIGDNVTGFSVGFGVRF